MECDHEQRAEALRFSGPHGPSVTRLESVIIIRYLGGFPNLYAVNYADGKLTKLTDDYYSKEDPSWSPDGVNIVYSSDRTKFGKAVVGGKATGGKNLFVLNTETGVVH